MKKLLILIAVVFVSTIGFSQTRDLRETLANEIIKTNDATVIETQYSEEDNHIIAQTPNYYSEDLVKMEVRRVVNRLSDVRRNSHWERQKEHNITQWLYIDNTGLLLISYKEDTQLLIFVWASSD